MLWNLNTEKNEITSKGYPLKIKHLNNKTGGICSGISMQVKMR